tara:strand:- start:69706 stop:70305 length:600 start_codon:yes stop_codon:yes gene_type:complete
MISILEKFNLIMVGVISMLLSTITFGQNHTENTSKREGFIIEFSVGGGIISVEDSAGIQTFKKSQGALTFPDLKLGYMLNEKLAVTVSMPGMIYEFQENDRHFGGFIPSLQYWVKDRWWIHGGIGLAIDSPALYDIQDHVNDDWNFGCAVMASTGYEIYKKKNFALNIQSNLVLGRAFLENEMHRDAVTVNVGLGFNWL